MDENSKKIVTDYILNNFWTRIHTLLQEELKKVQNELEQALGAEATTRTTEDTKLNNSISTLTDVTDGLQNSVTTINGKITTLDTNIKANTSSINTNATNIKANTSSINSINGKISTINNNITTLDTNIKANTTSIDTINGKISTLNGTGEGSVKKAVSDGIASVVAGADASFDTLKEISDWISEHSDSASEMNQAINTNTKNISNHISNKSNPHGVTKSQIGLGNVGNFKAVSTVASQGLTADEKSNARTNIGAGTSSFSGSYNDLSNKPSSFTPSSHTHDDRYYTESEIDTKLKGLVQGTLNGTTLTLTTI